MKRTAMLIFLTALFLSACAGEPTPVPTATLSMDELVETAVALLPTVTPTPTETATPAPTWTPTATFGPSPTPTLGPEYFHGAWDYDVTWVSQEGLKYRGSVIATGCTAASVQMVLAFWHEYDEKYEIIPAQRLIDLNAAQGRFDPKSGLNITNTFDELEEKNYYLGIRQNSDKKELLDALYRFGPLLVLTKSGWSPFSANHMAVLSGYDWETDSVFVMDPLVPGGYMEMPFESFDGIWALNYSASTESVLQRAYFFIIPYDQIRPKDEFLIPNMDNPNYTGRYY